MHSEIEGVSIAEKLRGCTASAEREEEVNKIAGCQFTIDVDWPGGAEEPSPLGGPRYAGRHPINPV